MDALCVLHNIHSSRLLPYSYRRTFYTFYFSSNNVLLFIEWMLLQYFVFYSSKTSPISPPQLPKWLKFIIVFFDRVNSADNEEIQIYHNISLIIASKNTLEKFPAEFYLKWY